MPTVIPGQTPRPSGSPSRETLATTSPAPRGGAEPRIPDERVPRANGLLSSEQKKNLSILARSAFEKHSRAGLIETGVTFDDWRHAEVAAATGGEANGLREATNRQFRQIRGHFANLNGDGGTAIQDAIHGSPEEADRDQADAILRRECRRKGHDYPAYPAVICRQQYKCPLSEATIKQLWSLIYTVRNR